MGPPLRAAWLRVGGVACLVVAVLLAALALTRFEEGPPPDPSSPAYRDYERGRLADARSVVFLGIGVGGALLGAFACFSRGKEG